MSVITPSKFDVSKLSVSDIKKLDNGSSQVYINYNGGKLRVQAPRMHVPYDANDYQGNEKYKAQLSFKGKETNTKLQKYFDIIESIDNFVIDVATKNAGKWFKMPGASREMIALFFSPSIKYSKDKDGNINTQYAPTQPIALKKRNNAFDAELYDDKNQLMEGITPVEVLRRNAEVTPINDVTGIWIADKKFGLTWKLHQARVDIAGEGGTTRGFMGVDDEDGENTVVVKPAAAGAGNTVSEDDENDLMACVLPTKSAHAPAESEEEEEEDDDEEIVQPVPVPVAKPKVTASTAPKTTKVVKKVVRAA